MVTLRKAPPAKRKKMKSKSNINVVNGIILLTLLVWIVGGLYFFSSLEKIVIHPGFTIPIAASTGKKRLTPPEANAPIFNPWDGWQPEIPSNRDCSWRKCFREKHSCESCRDAVDDMGTVPATPKDWIPDVTMLRRMLLKGSDANGNPFPPPLDSELCEVIGTNGGKVADNNKVLIETLPIVTKPFDWEGDQKQPKVMCMVYTMADAHAGKIRAIRETWGGGCDGFLAFSTESDPRIPAISLPHDGPEEYNNMWQKVRSIWRFVGTHYVNDFDFFLIGGDDLYVLPQNLRDYLSTVGSAEEDHFIGRRFKGGRNYFNSGGAGYVLSRGTLKRFMGMLDDKRCDPTTHTAQEDVRIASCLLNHMSLELTDTRDESGRERFHPFTPDLMYRWEPPEKGGHDWYEEYNKEWGLKLGIDCCAPDSVSFHYLKNPAMVRHLHALLYTCHQVKQ